MNCRFFVGFSVEYLSEIEIESMLADDFSFAGVGIAPRSRERCDDLVVVYERARLPANDFVVELSMC